MQSLGFTSVPPLLKYLRHAEQLGMAIEPALAAAGLQAQQLSDNTLRLPGEAHERLLDYFCEHSGDPLFGLNAANFVLPNSWSVLGYITMNCATLGDAMNRIHWKATARHGDLQVGVLELRHEGVFPGRVERRALGVEVLEVQHTRRPALAQAFQLADEAVRAAGVNARVSRHVSQYSRQRQTLTLRLHVQMQVGRVVTLQPRQQGHLRARAPGVMDLVGLAQSLEAVGHGHDGRDADATRKQHEVPGRLIEFEQVFRP